jgi:O-acetyl-ADP-ribose deacetylase (regulator of RNase III)
VVSRHALAASDGARAAATGSPGATGASRMQVVQGDITELDVDAIVNAANSSLLGGGGVDGAIHRAAGPGLLAECRRLGGCPTGEARITGGHGLKARHVIHTVGPVYRDGRHGEQALLRSCYLASLRLAEAHGLRSIAFPCIATGAYGYPKTEACDVAVTAAGEWLSAHSLPERVIFACLGQDAAQYGARLAP